MVTALIHTKPRLRRSAYRICSIILVVWAIQVPGTNCALAESAPISPHHAAWLHHRHHATQPALIGPGGQPQPLSSHARRAAQTQRAVFGFLPYWISAEYYDSIDFDLLTHIAPFSVEVNADGSLGEDHGWPWTALIDRAHRHGVRVILTATLFGDADVRTLLNSETHRTRFMREIRDKIRAGNADGVNIDFEGPGLNGWPDQISGFLRALTDYLHAEIPGSEVSFASPAIDWGGRWDFAQIAASCDYLFVMGYAFSGKWSSSTGPTAPLGGPGRTVASLLEDDRDYGQVTRDHPEKLILGVPYYGCKWKTRSGEPNTSVQEFINYPRLRDAIPQAARWGARWDARSQTAWYRYRDGEEWIQVWYDDVESLRRKYDLALDNDLRGFGMWALGYEGDQIEPWQLIEEVNGRRTPTLVQSSAAVPEAFAVASPYPNPFNTSVAVRYRVPGPGRLQIDLYDVLGRRIHAWSQRAESAGFSQWRWNGRNPTGQETASGVYTMHFQYQADDGSLYSQSRRVVQLR